MEMPPGAQPPHFLLSSTVLQQQTAWPFWLLKSYHVDEAGKNVTPF